MVFNHKAYEELYPRKEKQPKQAPAKKAPKMGNVLEEAEQAPDDPDTGAPDPDIPEGGENQDGDE